MSEERDPVCGVNIETGSAAATREYKGEIFYFCSFGCAGDFAADPSRYVGTDRKEDRETPVAQHRHHHETPIRRLLTAIATERTIITPAPPVLIMSLPWRRPIIVQCVRELNRTTQATAQSAVCA